MRKKESTKRNRTLNYSTLEPRRLLAIIWVNPDPAGNGFNNIYGANAQVATEVVQHAIDTWNDYIVDFNFINVGEPFHASQENTFEMLISAGRIYEPELLANTFTYPVDSQGKPYKSTTVLDDFPGGGNWYFDPDVTTDSEFSRVNAAFSADITGPFVNRYDLFTVMLREIGYAVGFGNYEDAQNAEELMHTDLRIGNRRLISENTLNDLVDPNEYGFDYTLTNYTVPDNLYVNVENGNVNVRGMEGDVSDEVLLYSNNNRLVARINGHSELIDFAEVSSFSVNTLEGDDIVNVWHYFESFYTDGVVDTGDGEDSLFYWTPDSSYRTYANDNYVSRYYRFFGPAPSQQIDYNNLELLTVKGGSGDDLVDIESSDVEEIHVFGEGGDDLIDALGTTVSMSVWGGDGDDIIYASNQNDYLRGGTGNDYIYGLAGDDQLHGDSGNDVLIASFGNDYVRGGDGDDHINGGTGNDLIYGDMGADTLIFWGTSGNDFISAFVGVNGDVRARTTNGSFAGSVLEVDSFFTDEEDFMLLLGSAGDDLFRVVPDVGVKIDGRIDGGDGLDVVEYLPTNWDQTNTDES